MDYKTEFSTSFSVHSIIKPSNKIALITGISGQDGSYLAEFLLNKGYDVYGLLRRSSTNNTSNIKHILPDIKDIFYTDLLDSNSLNNIIYTIQPDEVYNLAAQSHVGISFNIPEYTSNVVALGPLRILEAIRNYSPYTKFYQASTSEMFGGAVPPQSENTVKHPNNPYGIAKLYAHEMTRLYRQSYGIFGCCGILFNHESERRGEEFVTQKIVKGLINCKLGNQNDLKLGNIDSIRDWGYAKDYVECMWMMLQQNEPDDYVIGTGEAHSVKDFLEVVGSCVKLDWRKYVKIDSDLYRPTETSYLLADIKKAKEKLGWEPKTSFEELVNKMVDAEFNRQGINK